jgi:DNA-binding NtrC family response regulator
VAKTATRVLVAGRESDATRARVAALRARGYDVAWSRDGESALNAIDREPPDAVITVLRAPRIDGAAILRRAVAKRSGACLVVVGDGAPSDALAEALRLGAADVPEGALHHERLLAALDRGLAHRALEARAGELERALDERRGLEAHVGRSRAMADVLERIRHVASTRTPVLLDGETGTGKRRLGETIHQLSPRRGERFVWLNCGALPADVIEGELFGLARGAEGPDSPPRAGGLQLADGGTLFLDEVAEAPPAVQAKLLRFLHERSFERVGGTDTLRADVRLIASSGAAVAEAVRAGRFREDLFQRLGVVRVTVPPLRERLEDLPLLVERFIREFNREHGRKVAGMTRGALERLLQHPWPGNVRELRNTIEAMIVLADRRRPLDLSDLPTALRDPSAGAERLGLAVGMTVEEAERRLLVATLEHTGNDKARAAAMLGIGLRTLYRKVKQLGLR